MQNVEMGVIWGDMGHPKALVMSPFNRQQLMWL